jgi:hypothetical protein
VRARIDVAIAALFLAVGVAGPPLEPLRILAAALLAGGVVAAGRYYAAVALVAVIAGGWLQHGKVRLALLAVAAILAIATHATRNKPLASGAIAAGSAATGLAFLFLS